MSKKLKTKKFKAQIASCIEELLESTKITEVKSIKKLKGGDIYYRIRFQDYRLGLICHNEQVTMVRCLNRKDIYKYFPKK